MFNLLPTDTVFYDLFEDMSRHIITSAEMPPPLYRGISRISLGHPAKSARKNMPPTNSPTRRSTGSTAPSSPRSIARTSTRSSATWTTSSTASTRWPSGSRCFTSRRWSRRSSSRRTC